MTELPRDDRPPFDERFTQLLARWRDDPDVLGVALHGSRGLGSWDEHSDYDYLLIIPEQGNDDELAARLCPPGELWDPWPLTISTLRGMAEQPSGWTPGMMDSRVVLDKTGELTAVLAQMGRLTPEQARRDAAAHFDAYLNDFVRSIKAARKGYRLDAHLAATRSMHFLLQALFALNGWLAPYPDRVSFHWHKLALLPCPVEELQAHVEQILQTPERLAQVRLEELMTAFMTAQGLPPEPWPGLDKEKQIVVAPDASPEEKSLPTSSFHHSPLPAYSTLLAGHTPRDEVGFRSEQLQIWYNQTDESWVGAGERPHYHEESDECFLVLEGALVVEVEGRRVRVGPREFCCFPRGLVHAVVEVHPPVETLMIRAPSVMDKVYPDGQL